MKMMMSKNDGGYDDDIDEEESKTLRAPQFDGNSAPTRRLISSSNNLGKLWS